LCSTPYGFVGDTTLSPQQVHDIVAWSEAGAPEGEATRDPPPAPVPPSLDRWDLELAPHTPVTLEREMSARGRVVDEHLCWAFDLGLQETSYLTGLEVVPGNRSVVHHVRIDVGTADDADRANEQGWFSCDATSYGERAAAWVPGAQPFQTPAGVGFELEAGAHLVMLVHYHVPTDEPETDSTSLRVRLSEEPPEAVSRNLKLGNYHVAEPDGTGLQHGPDDPGHTPVFRVPAGSPDHTETMVHRVVADGQIWLVGHHMHYAGVEARLTLTRSNPAPDQPAEACLLHVPAWSFDWQMFYPYNDPSGAFVDVRVDDLLTLQCTYDNTLENTRLRDALEAEGVDDVVALPLSEGTLSEMCASLLGVITAD
jgi:hypothetical protein